MSDTQCDETAAFPCDREMLTATSDPVSLYQALLEAVDKIEALESERDEARQKCADWIRDFRALRTFARYLDEEANNLLRERDEAIESLRITQKAWVKAKTERAEAICERDEAREQLRMANVEANALAQSIQKTEYSGTPEFELCDTVAGVISQIDNMYAGVRQQRDEARWKAESAWDENLRLDAENAKLRELAERAIFAISNEKGFGGGVHEANKLRAELDQIKEGAK